MINLFITKKHTYTIKPFLESWPNSAAGDFRIIPYEKMHLIQSIRPGIFVFADLERLSTQQMQKLMQFCEIISANFDELLIINHPAWSLLRYDLLCKMWEEGINDFRVFRYDAPDSEIRYPVFLRKANDHNGPLTGIILNKEHRLHAIDEIRMTGTDLREVIVVEFCDTSDTDGLFRKYSAFRVGDRIVPGHIICSPDWVTKNSAPEPMRQEEKYYLQNNPHEDELMNIFEHARIEFGRIDYGILRGKIQVWEINTNPVLIQKQNKYSADKLPSNQLLVDSLANAFKLLGRRAERISHHRVNVPRIFSGLKLRHPWDLIGSQFREL